MTIPRQHMEPQSSLTKGIGSAAETVTTLAVLGGLILVPLLGWQNARLRGEQASARSVATESLQQTLFRLIALSKLEGTTLPEFMVQRMEASVPGDKRGDARPILVIAYMPTVCGVSLRAGLESLRSKSGEQDHVRLHALVGEQGRGDRVGALRLRQTGLVWYPITFIPAEQLFDQLFSHLGSEFAEEPVYIRLDHDYRILSAFQADQRRPELLDRWLMDVL